MATTTTQAFRRELLPPALTFYEQELGKLSCPRRGWSTGRCPFHESRSGKSFSVHVDGAFFCFGCGVKGGDVVAFVRLRDHCDFSTACKRLGAWQNVSDADRRLIAHQSAEREKKQAEEARLKRLVHQQRIALSDEIHTTARIQGETSDRLSQLLQGATPANDDEAKHCWAVLSLALDDLRITKKNYMKLAGLEHAG
jgi:CHC2-type zinc finger protein